MKTPGSGRKKGTKNKNTAPAEELALELGIDPLKVLFYFVAGDWKSLGYESATTTMFSPDGSSYEVPIIKPEHRISAAKEAAQYIYPKKKALEITTGDQAGLALVIRDYTK